MLRGIVAMIDMRQKKTTEEYIPSFCTANKCRVNDKGDGGKGQPSNGRRMRDG